MEEPRIWPFAVPDPSARTPLQSQEVGFLEASYLDGFSPFVAWPNNYHAASPEGRTGSIVQRGRSTWEVVLCEAEVRRMSAYLKRFEVAAEGVLSWLRGNDLMPVVDGIRPHAVGLSAGVPAMTLSDAPTAGTDGANSGRAFEVI